MLHAYPKIDLMSTVEKYLETKHGLKNSIRITVPSSFCFEADNCSSISSSEVCQVYNQPYARHAISLHSNACVHAQRRLGEAVTARSRPRSGRGRRHCSGTGAPQRRAGDGRAIQTP